MAAYWRQVHSFILIIAHITHICNHNLRKFITNGRCLVVTPVRQEAEERKFQQALEKVHRRFARAMKKPAE